MCVAISNQIVILSDVWPVGQTETKDLRFDPKTSLDAFQSMKMQPQILRLRLRMTF